MKPAAFDYVRARSVSEATDLLAKKEGDAKILAGGQSLTPMLNLRLARSSLLIDIKRAEGLRSLEADGSIVAIGAGWTHAEIEDGAVEDPTRGLMRHVARGIAYRAVRNRGTIGGSVANNDPSADYPAAVLGLGATVVTNMRDIPADQYFVGLFETALQPGEIITAIRFPVPLKAGYAKFKAPASRYALVGVFVAQFADGVRVAVTGAGPGVFRVPPMEQALAQHFDPSAVAAIRIDTEGLTSDIHAEADYRAHLVTVMAKRAVDAALS